MSGGPRSRFPRTTGSVSADRLTIEREKIRHRRPDDMRVHGPHEAPPSADPMSSQDWPDDEGYDDAQSPWSEDNDEWPDQKESLPHEGQDWDEGSDDEWVFDDPATEDPTADRLSEDAGITWEEDGDDIQIGASNVYDDFDDAASLGPEVELAGRRDVRPRPPKPRSTQARRQRPVDDGRVHARSRTSEDYIDGDVAPGRPPSPVRQPAAKPSRGRFARTQATIEIDSDQPPAATPRIPSLQTNHRPPSRRRQPQPAAPPPRIQQRGLGRRPLMTLVILALIVTGGWLTFQSLGEGGIAGLIKGWSESLGASGSGRTASDTPFGSSPPPDEGLADLTREQGTTEFLPSGTENGTNSQTGGPLSLPRDPVISGTDGPPIPQFKPRNDAAGLTGAPNSSVQVQQLDVEDLAGKSDDDATDGPSAMQKIWGYLVSE